MKPPLIMPGMMATPWASASNDSGIDLCRDRHDLTQDIARGLDRVFLDALAPSYLSKCRKKDHEPQ